MTAILFKSVLYLSLAVLTIYALLPEADEEEGCLYVPGSDARRP